MAVSFALFRDGMQRPFSFGLCSRQSSGKVTPDERQIRACVAERAPVLVPMPAERPYTYAVPPA